MPFAVGYSRLSLQPPHRRQWAARTAWAQAQVTQSQIADHGRRIERLETGDERSGQVMTGIQADLAVVKADSATLKEDARDIKQKLDMLIERQLRGEAPR